MCFFFLFHDNIMALLSLFLSPLKKIFGRKNVAQNGDSLLHLTDVALLLFFFFNSSGKLLPPVQSEFKQLLSIYSWVNAASLWQNAMESVPYTESSWTALDILHISGEIMGRSTNSDEAHGSLSFKLIQTFPTLIY